jgi:hypothetical protein
MNPIIFKLKYQNPRSFENLPRGATVYKDDLRGFWCVTFCDEGGKSWIEKNFRTKQSAEIRKKNFLSKAAA